MEIQWAYMTSMSRHGVLYDGRKVTTYTTHQWYVVLEVFCVVYVGKPPTRHTNGMSCWRYFVLCMSVNLHLQHLQGPPIINQSQFIYLQADIDKYIYKLIWHS